MQRAAVPLCLHESELTLQQDAEDDALALPLSVSSWRNL